MVDKGMVDLFLHVLLSVYLSINNKLFNKKICYKIKVKKTFPCKYHIFWKGRSLCFSAVHPTKASAYGTDLEKRFLLCCSYHFLSPVANHDVDLSKKVLASCLRFLVGKGVLYFANRFLVYHR